MIEQFEIGRWYHDGKRAFEILAVQSDEGRLIVRYENEPQPVRRTISGMSVLATPLDGPPKPPDSPGPKKGNDRSKDSDTTFTVRETAPVTTELIRKRSAETGDFVPHDELVELILSDASGRRLVEQAIVLGNPNTPQEIAGNMIDHLSASITKGKSEYAAQFERQKIDGTWAYKPR